MWEWILAVVLIIFLYLFLRPNLTEAPGCKACAKRSENPAD